MDSLNETVDITGVSEVASGVVNVVASGVVRLVLELYFNGLLLACLSLFGITTNVVNIIIFVSVCLHDSSPLPLLALSISDLGQLVFLCINSFSLVVRSLLQDLTIDPNSISVAVASWPRNMFADISVLTTMYISIERSLCVALPFRFRGLFKKSHITLIMLLFYLFGFGCYLPVYLSLRLSWRWDEGLNSTRLLWHAEPSYRAAERFVSSFNSIGLTTLGQVTVMTSTGTLIFFLRKSSTFQLKATHVQNSKTVEHKNKVLTSHASAMSKRNKNLSKMVLLISAVFVACNIPTVITVYSLMFVPSFSQRNAYLSVASIFYCFVFFFGGLHASVNTFIYYHMSTRYRVKFQRLLGAIDFRLKHLNRCEQTSTAH